MKLALLIGSVAIAGAWTATYGPGELALFSLKSNAASPQYLGYVEGETTLVAPPVAGWSPARQSAATGSRRVTGCSPSTPRRPKLRSHVPPRASQKPRHATATC
jgi:hypothetical protein